MPAGNDKKNFEVTTMRKKEFRKITGLVMVIALFACIFTYRIYADETNTGSQTNEGEVQEGETPSGETNTNPTDQNNNQEKKEEETPSEAVTDPADKKEEEEKAVEEGKEPEKEPAKDETPESDKKEEEEDGAKKSGAKNGGEDNSSSSSQEVGDFVVTGNESNYTYDADNGVLIITGDVAVRNRDGVEKTNERIIVAGNAKVTLEGINIETGAYLTEEEFAELTRRDSSFTGLTLPSIIKNGITYVNASFNNDFDAAKTQNVLFNKESDTHSGSPITINPGVKATLELKADTQNTVKGFSILGDWNKIENGFAGIEVARDDNSLSELTIIGEGNLTAYGGYNGAGIGGTKRLGKDSTYGDIIILSGNVTAESGSGAAGIGSGSNPDSQLSSGSYKHGYPEWGKIQIGELGTTGPNVKATGYGNGAGIGGGNHMDSGDIFIYSGYIEAVGDSGIGSGLGSSKGEGKGPGFYCAHITIEGGTIKAFASNNMGAGIGGGMYSDAYIKITGGDITASVSLNGKDYQGGAGIGGGYQGVAVVEITGGKVVATGGNGSAGIGNGALGATTTTSSWSTEENKPTGTKQVRDWNPTIKANECLVKITGGEVYAYGGSHAAGIGSGNASQWANVEITGGKVFAQGGLSSKSEMEGGAGIGSGASSVKSKKEYYQVTDVNVKITGGDVLAVGGWGAAGIGSGASNKMANFITLDNTNSDIVAYADGTKFAIDTRDLDKTTNITTSHTEGRTIDGYILQGTFVHEYDYPAGNNEEIHQGTEGLKDIQIINDKTNWNRQLVGMPEGYRSFAATVSEAGTYTVYTDSDAISKGKGRYFAEYYKDEIDDTYWSSRIDQNRFVQYQVTDDIISDNFYLYPVKSIVVDKEIVLVDGMKPSDLNTTVYFAIREKAYKLENGQQVKDTDPKYFVRLKDGSIWIQSIDIVDGVPQNKVYFTNVEDKTYEVLEVDEEGNVLNAGIAYGSTILKKIETGHGDAEDNDGVISKEVWTDRVTVINTYAKDNKIDVVIRKLLPTEYKFDSYNDTTVIFKVSVVDNDNKVTYETFVGMDLSADSASYNQELEKYVYEKRIKNIPVGSSDSLLVEEVYSAGYLGEVSAPVLVNTDTDKYYRVDTLNTIKDYIPGSGAVNSYHNKTHVSKLALEGGE